MKKVWSMFMLLAVCLVACTNIDDLEDDVDALKKRVTALETQVRDINSNTKLFANFIMKEHLLLI